MFRSLLCPIMLITKQVVSFHKNIFSCQFSKYGLPTDFELKDRGILTVQRYHNPQFFNPLTPNDPYRGRTAPLTSKHFILYIYSTNIGTEYFKHGIYSPFFPLKNAVCFINLTYLVSFLFTFYIQDVLKLKKNNSFTKSLIVICCEWLDET